jgi:pentapeptide MXKDX repeat protein
MKKLMMALLAGFVTFTFAGAYAVESKGDEMKSDTAKSKSAKGMAKKDAAPKDAMTKDDTKKKGKSEASPSSK